MTEFKIGDVVRIDSGCRCKNCISFYSGLFQIDDLDRLREEAHVHPFRRAGLNFQVAFKRLTADPFMAGVVAAISDFPLPNRSKRSKG